MWQAVLLDGGVEVDAGSRHADEPVRKTLAWVAWIHSFLRRPLENGPDLRLEAALVAPGALPQALLGGVGQFSDHTLAIRAPRVTGSSVDITAIARSRQARSRRALRGRKCCTLRSIRSALAGRTLWTVFLLSVTLALPGGLPGEPPPPSHPRTATKESRHVQCWRRAMRGSHQQCPRRGQPPQRREVVRPEDPRRQGALGAERAQARFSRAKAHRAAGRGCRGVPRARGGADRGAGARGRAPVRARAAGRLRGLAARARRAARGRAVRRTTTLPAAASGSP